VKSGPFADPTMDAPIPFITTGVDGTGLAVNKEAKEILNKINKPMVIVSVVGMYRTGKSFFAQLLDGENRRFSVGCNCGSQD